MSGRAATTVPRAGRAIGVATLAGFVPRHCRVRGNFPDGYEAEAPMAPVEQFDSRIVAVVVALAMVAAAFVAYFFYLI